MKLNYNEESGPSAGYELVTYNARNKIKKSNEKARLFP